MLVNKIILTATLWCAAATLSSPAANLYFTDVNGFVSGRTAFQGVFLWNQQNATYNDSLNQGLGDAVQQSWSGTADLPTGALRLRATASNNGTDGSTPTAYTSVITAFGDTYTYSGTAAQGAAFTGHLGLTGTFAQNTLGLATIMNQSYLRVYFLKPGSFDAIDILDSANIISDTIWGVGPNATPIPGAPPYAGNIASFPGGVSVSAPAASLASGFQVLVLLQVIMSGDTQQDPGSSLDWDVDLGHTLHYGLGTPQGLSVTAAGGSPLTSAVPEPATVATLLAGLAVVAWRRPRR